MRLSVFTALAGAVPIIGCLALPALAQSNPDIVTYFCTYPDAPVDPHSITIDLSQGSVTEIYPDPNAPANFTLFNGKPDKNGDVLHLTVTDTTIDIDISNPDPQKIVDDQAEQINRATGQTTVTSQTLFVGAGQCTTTPPQTQP